MSVINLRPRSPQTLTNKGALLSALTGSHKCFKLSNHRLHISIRIFVWNKKSLVGQIIGLVTNAMPTPASEF
ncbi:MAG TPA: hypothetical protein VF099_15910 [Ktedonobacterales bacterium]